MKKLVLTFVLLIGLITVFSSKPASAACVTVNLSCYDGYMACGLTTERLVEAAIDAEEAICN